MKTLLKSFLPAFLLFAAFARVTKLDDLHRHISGPLTEVSVTSLMFYFQYFAPLVFVILCLTQYLVVLPLWERVTDAGRFRQMILVLASASLLLSGCIAWFVWDGAVGVWSLMRSLATMLLLQYVYWLLNLFVLYLIDSVYNLKLRVQLKA